MIIDIHAHFYPLRFLEQFDHFGRYGFEVQRDGAGNRVLSRHGKRIAVYTPSFYDLDNRMEEMDKGKVDREALSIVQPGVFWAEAELGLYLCQLVNEEVAQIAQSYPNHFIAIATVPLQDVDRSLTELERAVRVLGCQGVSLGTSINGMDLDDAALEPFYKKVEELDIPILVHPFAWGHDYTRLAAYFLDGAPIGFMFENTIALLKVIFGGVLEKFPRLKFCFAHLGGTAPYLFGRIEKAAILRPEMRSKIPHLPSSYFRKIYLDTAYFYSPAIPCALSCIPEEHLLFGTDYPFFIGDTPEKAVAQIQEGDSLSPSLKKKILATNPAAFLGINESSPSPFL